MIGEGTNSNAGKEYDFAEMPYGICQMPVIVEAGIHYDNLKKEQIQEILKRLEEELEKIIQYLT